MNAFAMRELGEVARRFVAADMPETVTRTGDYEVVTGFGPTNAPTAGTLSVMEGIVELQARLQVPVTVVISDLGAWNSRNLPWDDLCRYRDQMARFLIALGFDDRQGAIRTHVDLDNLIRSGRIARYLDVTDFETHSESFQELYGAHGVLGSGVGVLVDALYTVADILQPIDQAGRSVLMVSGVEEAYFTHLAQLVLKRQLEQVPSLGWSGELGALYFRVVRGLAGYPKMSKSIPRSSLHLGLSEDEIAERILSSRAEDQPAIWDAIDLASGWSPSDRKHASNVYDLLPESAPQWEGIRRRYVATFCEYARIWNEQA
jgi:hypothetical protein